MSWFDEWFNSPYYPVLYAHRNEAEARAFLERLVSFLELRPGETILDIACGRGRHALILSQLGFKVEGIDLSERSIQEAKVHENESLKFTVWNACKTYKAGSFDVATSLFTSFGYQETDIENLKCLEASVGNIKRGGLYILDFMNASAVMNNLVPAETIEREGYTFHIIRQLKKGRVIKTIQVEDQGQTHEYQESVRAYFPSDFHTLFTRVGLEILYRFGNYELGPYNGLKSDRLILVARKTKGLV